MNNKRLLSLSLATVVMLSLFVVACGKKDASDKKSDSQIVAKVNGDEISIHQVNFQLARLGPLNEEQGKAAAKEVLNNLVNQQLLKQKAIEAKIDRDPRVLQMLEATKDQILAQAYLEQETTKAAKPSASEVDKFYTEHPELFEHRRVYKLQELAIDADAGKQADIEKTAQEMKDIKSIAEWLKSQDIKFSVNANARAAEQLPGPILQQLKSLQDGEMTIVKNDHSMNILFLAGSQTMPIAKDKATPVIEQYFVNQNKTSLIQKQMEELTKTAKIEYLGEFANMKSSNVQNTSTKPQETTKAEASTKSDDASSHLDKGLSGL